MLRLTKTQQSPKGGWTYEQPETGRKFGGNTGFREQAFAIRSHRLGNKLARATMSECIEDLAAFTCNRLPGICIDDGKVAVYTPKTGLQQIPKSAPAPEPKRKGCHTCGGRKK